MHVLVTAGPTREPIDPVRFISNRSSGKMGFAVAQAAAEAGARVTLIAGPVNHLHAAGRRRASTWNRRAQMHEATLRARRGSGHLHRRGRDFRLPARVRAGAQDQEAQRQAGSASDQVRRRARRGGRPAAGPAFTVGFAAETEKLEAHALEKLQRKQLDLIVANLVGTNLGFDRDDNSAVLLWPGGGRHEITQTSKCDLARQIVALIAERYRARSPTPDPPLRALPEACRAAKIQLKMLDPRLGRRVSAARLRDRRVPPAWICAPASLKTCCSSRARPRWCPPAWPSTWKMRALRP